VDYQTIAIPNILVHPGYSPVSIENDVAILWLPRSLRFSDRVRRVNLPPEPALVGCHIPTYNTEELKKEREECIRSAVNNEGLWILFIIDETFTVLFFANLLKLNCCR